MLEMRGKLTDRLGHSSTEPNRDVRFINNNYEGYRTLFYN